MATTPVKETTPTSDAVNVDVAVTTEKEKTPEVTPSTLFTEKEQKLIMKAMFCLKGGPPEIDYQKFVKAGEFNTLKTAQNTWGKIKAKLNTLAPKVEDDGEEGAEAGATPKTPKSTKATPKKRTKSGEDGSPSKKKSPVKKVKDEDAE